MPTRNERLADHYLRASGIAGVSIQYWHGGAKVDWLPVITIDPLALVGRDIFCCARPNYALHIARLAQRDTPIHAGQAAAVAAVQSIAASEGIGLTPHAKVIARALEAVATVNSRVEEMRAVGELRAINREFKAARKRGEVATYADFLHEKKAQMLETLAGAGKNLFRK